MESNGCAFVFSKIGVTYMFFCIGQEKQGWNKLLTRFSKLFVCPNEGCEMKIKCMISKVHNMYFILCTWFIKCIEKIILCT